MIPSHLADSILGTPTAHVAHLAWVALSAALLIVGGCTLVFDTDLEFEERDLLVVDANNSTNNNNGVEGLGMLCGTDADRLCDPGREWPKCAHDFCVEHLGKGGTCVVGLSPKGFCTVPCGSDSDCKRGEPSTDPFVGAMRCIEGSNGRYCLPRSDTECSSDLDCTGGELCKLTELEPGNPLSVAPRCEPPLPRGLAAGQYCNADPRRGPVSLCANGRCVDDICSHLCPEDGTTPVDGYCGSPLLVCTPASEVPDEVAGELGICSPVPCRNPNECRDLVPSEDPFCSPYLAPEVLEQGVSGGCRLDNPEDYRNLELGQICRRPDGEIDQGYCASRWCLGIDPDLRCSAVCDINSDCADNQLCAISKLDNTGVFAKVCRYAVGAQTICSGRTDCEAGQICAPYIFGDVSADGLQVIDARLEGRCIKPQSGGVPTGTSCRDLPCEVPGACLSYDDGALLCSSVCNLANFDDCGFGFYCRSLPYLGETEAQDGIARTLGFCVRIQL